MNSTAPQINRQEKHVLVINDQQRQVVLLNSATYSIGRSSTNDIVLNSDTVSRCHARLLRVNIPSTDRHRYQLVDGNRQGKPSKNGILVNGQRVKSHPLNCRDHVSLGGVIDIFYFVGVDISDFLVAMNADRINITPVKLRRQLFLTSHDPTSIMLGGCNHTERATPPANNHSLDRSKETIVID